MGLGDGELGQEKAFVYMTAKDSLSKLQVVRANYQVASSSNRVEVSNQANYIGKPDLN